MKHSLEPLPIGGEVEFPGSEGSYVYRGYEGTNTRRCAVARKGEARLFWIDRTVISPVPPPPASKRTLGKESLDFAAHAGSAFLILTAAEILGVYLTAEGTLLLAWSFGLIREFTEWQDGGRHPFTRWGMLDQLGWIAGGIAKVFLHL